MNIDKAKAERFAITAEQSSILEAARKEDRSYTEDELRRHTELQEAFDKLQPQIVAAEQALRNAGTNEEVIHDDSPIDDAPKQETRSLATQFVESEQFRNARKMGSIHSGPVETRTLLDSGSSSAGDLLVPDYQAGIRPLRIRRLTLADVVLSGTTDATAVNYFEESTFTNAAAATAEGAVKQESALAFNMATAPVQKIAHWIPVTDEMLDDVSGLRSFIDGRLVDGLRLEEEDQILNGDGTPPNIKGILDYTNLNTEIDVGTANPVDSVYGQITAIREDFYEPNAMVINPSDWGSTDFRLAKDQNDQYYAGGPFTGQYGNGGIVGDSLWGLRVVVTPVMAAGNVLVGDFNQAQMFRKQGITVESTNSHSDYFIYNKTVIRAEERFAFAVYAPLAFGLVDLVP